MSISRTRDSTEIGAAIYNLAAELYPICRSMTGAGVRETLAILARHVPLDIHDVPTGTQVYDWTVPAEWHIREAYIADASGRRIVDFRTNNLHIVGYSRPFRGRLPLAELKKHLHTLPDQPTLIPYRTTYYVDTWGFCLADEQVRSLPDGDYDVVVDTTLEDGHLTYGEHLHPGEREDEILLSAHVCHPSLANDNCSGLALLAGLAAALKGRKTRFSYRFIFAPGTIGAITWLARNEAGTGRIKAGLVVSCVGDGGGPTYKRSRHGTAKIDRVMAHVLRHSAPTTADILDFSPYGYDERQYGSPGFNLPVGLFQRSRYGTFPEYHTSADNLDFIAPEHLAISYRIVSDMIEIFETDGKFLNLCPKGEPRFSRYGLSFGGDDSMAMLWVLNLSDGDHTLFDIAERAGLPFAAIRAAAERLTSHGLLRPA